MNPRPVCPLPLHESAGTCAGYLLDFARWARHATSLQADCAECRRLFAHPQLLERAAFALRFESLIYSGRAGDVFRAIVDDLDFLEIHLLTD